MSTVKMNHIDNFSTAWTEFTQDPRVAHASYSITILDGKTGSILFQHAKDVGLSPASSMKTITAAAALHYLGPDYTYETSLAYSGNIISTTGFLDGYIHIVGSGDPSLGSWRYDETITADFIVKKWIKAIKDLGIQRCRGIIGDTSRWRNPETIITDGWTWNDIGHWYGAGCSALNWRENEFSIAIQPGPSENSPARIISIKNAPPNLKIINELITSSSPSGIEQSLYFLINGSNVAYLRGNVPPDVPSDFSLRCAVPNSALYAADELARSLRANEIVVDDEAATVFNNIDKLAVINIHRSLPLLKLLYQFLPMTINMYGEVLVRTIAHEIGLSSINDAPLIILPTYVKTLLDDTNLLSSVATTDGSGLSRSNRLSTHALAQILYRVQNETWFNDFHEAFPIINGLRMKSGTLLNTVAYAGYVRENSFVFSFIINNYHGENVVNMRKKVWQLLDRLK